MKPLLLVILLLAALLLAACRPLEKPTPDFLPTIDAALRTALPTPSSASIPDGQLQDTISVPCGASVGLRTSDGRLIDVLALPEYDGDAIAPTRVEEEAEQIVVPCGSSVILETVAGRVFQVRADPAPRSARAVLPTPTPTPLPRLNPTPSPTPTPNIIPAIVEEVLAAIAAMATPTPTSAPAPLPTPTPAPAPLPTPTPSPVLAPTSTPTPLPTEAPPTPSPTLSAVIERVRSSVVKIQTGFGTGSGVIFELDRSDNSAYILTNYHVIQGDSTPTIFFNDSLNFRGTVQGIDTARDLAVVKICCNSSFPSLTFASDDSVTPGSEVVAMGYPLGASIASVTKGIVSAKNFDDEFNSWVLQTDASINPGNSGGPLLSLSGEILGINTFKVIETNDGIPVEGIGFAISERTISQVLPNLKAGASSAAPESAVPPGSSNGLYVSGKHWYTIEMPVTWRQDLSNDDAVVVWDLRSGATLWVTVDELDLDAYPTLESYVARFQPAPSGAIANFRILSKRTIRQTHPVDAYEFVVQYRRHNDDFQGVTHWYLLGRYLVQVDADAPLTVWQEEQYAAVKAALEQTMDSFQPAAYTDSTLAYSLGHPIDWATTALEGYDYWVDDSPVDVPRVYVQVLPRDGYDSVLFYGIDHNVGGARVISKNLVFPRRPIQSFRIDYSLPDAELGVTLRGAVLITLIGDNALWVFVDDFQDNWANIKSLADDIFLRVAVKTPP